MRRPTEQDHFSILSLCHENPQVLRPQLEAVPGLFVQYSPFSADVSRNDLSKFEGIRILMDHWNLPAHAYAAFGDSLNDVEMLENAAIAIAPAASESAIQRMADHIAPPSSQGGLAAWMRQAGWIA